MRPVTIELDAAYPGELVEAAWSIVSELAARRAPGSPAACMETAEALARVLDVGEAALAALVGAVDRAAEPQRWGFASTTAWLKHRLGMRAGRAKERLVLARQLGRLPVAGRMFGSGEVSYGYAATIAHAVARLDDTDASAAERCLLEMRDQGCSAGQVAKAAQRIGDIIAERDGTEAPPADTKHGFTRSWIDKAKSLNGASWIRMWLNPEDTSIFEQVLEPLAKPASAADDRDHAHRLADALIGTLTNGHRRATLTVLINLDTLEGTDTPAHLPDGTPIPAERARQLALNAGVSALILGPDGHPLYLGRTARFATPRQRQVLEALYDTCAVTGCDIPTRLCEIHHTQGWKLGAPTDIDKLAPACGFHNRWIEDNPHRTHTTRDNRGRHVIHCLPPWETHHHTTPNSDHTNSGHPARQPQTHTGSHQPNGP